MSKETAMNMLNQTTTTPTTPTEVTSENKGLPTDESVTSRSLALFAKKEAKIQKEREDFKRQQEEFAKERDKVNEISRKAKEFDDLRTKDPIAALRLLGFSEADLFNYLSTNQKTEPTVEEVARKVAEEETKKVREELAREQQQKEEQTNKERIDNFKADIANQVKAKAEEFKLIAFRGREGEEQIYEYITEVLKETKELISIDEAMKDVEELYRMEAEEAYNMVKPKEEPKVEAKVETPPATPVAKPKPSTPPKTLSNKITPTVSAVANASLKRETPQEKRSRLEEALRRGYL